MGLRDASIISLSVYTEWWETQNIMSFIILFLWLYSTPTSNSVRGNPME